MIAEIIAIGDELVSGQRLDTNSQWLSIKLGELGIEPKFHCTVGDNLESGIDVFQTATTRSDIVITTGGIGPTKDDLTRQVISEVANAPLVFDETVEQHIKSIFHSYGREMPSNNRIQAFFPQGSSVIPNKEGTAPGIDLVIGNCRIFSLPGVPYEMKQMWEEYISRELLSQLESPLVIKNHSIHCFGAGESQIELMLQGMTERDHDPRVGITASQATITLRIAASGLNMSQCQAKIDAATKKIHDRLGNLVFGNNGDTLADVVCRELSTRRKMISVWDFGFGGDVGLALFHSDENNDVLLSSNVLPISKFADFDLKSQQESNHKGKDDIHLVISPIWSEGEKDLFKVDIHSNQSTLKEEFRFSGHSGLRQARTVKQVLNFIRLNLSFLSE